MKNYCIAASLLLLLAPVFFNSCEEEIKEPEKPVVTPAGDDDNPSPVDDKVEIPACNFSVVKGPETKSPKHLEIKGLDLKGAVGLVVMKTSKKSLSVTTKAGNENAYYNGIYTVDADGNINLAVTVFLDGSVEENDSFSKCISDNIALSPNEVVQVSDHFIQMYGCSIRESIQSAADTIQFCADSISKIYKNRYEVEFVPAYNAFKDSLKSFNSAYSKAIRDKKLTEEGKTAWKDSLSKWNEISAEWKKEERKWNSAISYDYDEAISQMTSGFDGDYLLRTTDGALFKASCNYNGQRIGNTNVETSDHNTLIISDPLSVLTPNGRNLDIIRFNNSTNIEKLNSVESVLLVDDSTVFPSSVSLTDNGAWCLDMSLKPRYYDFSDNMKSFFSSYSMASEYEYYYFVWKGDIHAIFMSCEKEKRVDPETGITKTISRYPFVCVKLKKENTTIDLEEVFKTDSLITPQGTKVKIPWKLEGRLLSYFNYFDYDGNLFGSSISFPAESGDGFYFINGNYRYFVNMKEKGLYRNPTPSRFPGTWNNNAVTYSISSDYTKIIKYDYMSLTTTEIPIHGDGFETGSLVECTTKLNLLASTYTITGYTRSGDRISIAVDCETGNILGTDTVEITDNYVSTYVRLN